MVALRVRLVLSPLLADGIETGCGPLAQAGGFSSPLGWRDGDRRAHPPVGAEVLAREPGRSGVIYADRVNGFLRRLCAGAPYDGLFERLRVGREEWLRSGALTAPSSVARSC